MTHTYTDWFGIRCDYTATRSNRFIFDDFKVSELSPDLTLPTITSAKALDESNIEVVFSERLQATSALMANNYSITNLGVPNNVQATALANVYKLVYTSALPTGEYKLTVNNVMDLAGNLIVANQTATFFYIKPYILKNGDVLISEVLSNPRTGGVDFVEIYNNTNQILDLKELQLANANATGVSANVRNVSSTSVYITPKTYWVLTTNPSVIKQYYQIKYPDQFIQMNSLPAFNNNRGTVILLGSAGILERFDYNESMHIGLLRDGDGVSLE